MSSGAKDSGKTAIVADDLTGANDTALQFAKHGLKAIVALHLASLADAASKADVVAIDTQTRATDPETASIRVREAVRALRNIGVQCVYKKIDSTLRGNVGAELEAVMHELSVKTCIFTPAFPANRRIVVGGHLLVDQIPLGMTDMAEERSAQLERSHVPTILRNQTKLRVEHIPLSKVLGGVASLKAEIERLKRRDAGIVVIDAETPQDLRVIAQAGAASNLTRLMCGSAGLAEALPDALKLHPYLPAVVIAGSPSTVTMQQIAKAREDPNVTILDLESAKTLNTVDGQKEIQRIVDEAVGLLETGKDVVITSCRARDSIQATMRLGRELGLNDVDVTRRVASALGESAKKIVEHDKIGGLILTGGETATEVLHIQGVEGLRVIDEVSPGIPFCEVIGAKHEGLKIITKAGAFGSPEAICESIQYLRRRSEIR